MWLRAGRDRCPRSWRRDRGARRDATLLAYANLLYLYIRDATVLDSFLGCGGLAGHDATGRPTRLGTASEAASRGTTPAALAAVRGIAHDAHERGRVSREAPCLAVSRRVSRRGSPSAPHRRLAGPSVSGHPSSASRAVTRACARWGTGGPAGTGRRIERRGSRVRGQGMAWLKQARQALGRLPARDTADARLRGLRVS